MDTDEIIGVVLMEIIDLKNVINESLRKMKNMNT